MHFPGADKNEEEIYLCGFLPCLFVEEEYSLDKTNTPEIILRVVYVIYGFEMRFI